MNILNPISITKQYPTQEDCIAHLEAVRWGGKPRCPYCSSDRSTPMNGEGRHHCNTCNTSFSVTVGTIFHHTHLPLQKWFLAIALILNSEESLSARHLARYLGVNKNTAWRMAMQIRKAMTNAAQRDPLIGIVEAYEGYVGGSAGKSRAQGREKRNPGLDNRKASVVRLFEKASGKQHPPANSAHGLKTASGRRGKS